MKFSKALVTLINLAPLFLFDQTTARSDEEGSAHHVVIPYEDEDDNSNYHNKERELESAVVTVQYGTGEVLRYKGFCGGQDNYECSRYVNAPSLGWNNGERDFTDPLNIPVNEMTFEIFGVNCRGVQNDMEASLNGSVLGQMNGFLADACSDDRCDSTSGTFSFNPAIYNVGGSNTIKIREVTEGLGSQICVVKVELTLNAAPELNPSSLPSMLPSSEPTWLDDEQCKKKDPENDICAELDGRCKVDCEDDKEFVCVPNLCSYDRNWDKPTKSPKMRQLKEDEVDVVDIEIDADGNTERKLKASKAPKSSCACRVPRARGCEI